MKVRLDRLLAGLIGAISWRDVIAIEILSPLGSQASCLLTVHPGARA